LSSILIYNTHRWQYNIKGDVKRMNRWFVYRNKKRTSVCIVYIFSSSSRYDDFVITVFHETDLLFALSFFFLFVKVNWLWLYMQIFFSMCTKCWYITFKKHIKQEKKKKNLVKAKKNQNEIRLNDFRNRKIFLRSFKANNSVSVSNVWTSK
jgi:predicted membrane protein